MRAIVPLSQGEDPPLHIRASTPRASTTLPAKKFRSVLPTASGAGSAPPDAPAASCTR